VVVLLHDASDALCFVLCQRDMFSWSTMNHNSEPWFDCLHANSKSFKLTCVGSYHPVIPGQLLFQWIGCLCMGSRFPVLVVTTPAAYASSVVSAVWRAFLMWVLADLVRRSLVKRQFALSIPSDLAIVLILIQVSFPSWARNSSFGGSLP